MQISSIFPESPEIIFLRKGANRYLVGRRPDFSLFKLSEISDRFESSCESNRLAVTPSKPTEGFFLPSLPLVSLIWCQVFPRLSTVDQDIARIRYQSNSLTNSVRLSARIFSSFLTYIPLFITNPQSTSTLAESATVVLVTVQNTKVGSWAIILAMTNGLGHAVVEIP